MKWFFNKLSEILRPEIEKYIYWAISQAQYDFRHELLATISVDELEKIVEKAKENRKTDGHSNYLNLTSLYSEIMKTRKESK